MAPRPIAGGVGGSTGPFDAGRRRVLLVDRAPWSHRSLDQALASAGYQPATARTGREALDQIERTRPDAVVLDLSLPQSECREMLHAARRFYDGPILVLAARNQGLAPIEALDAGANDYVSAPFRIEEMLSRLRMQLRRFDPPKLTPPIVHAGDLTIDVDRALVTRGGEVVHLSPTSYDILVRLVQADGRVISHRQLLTYIWGPAHADDVQYLRVYVGQLRQKIEPDPSAPRFIVTEPRIGYRFVGDRP